MKTRIIMWIHHQQFNSNRILVSKKQQLQKMATTTEAGFTNNNNSFHNESDIFNRCESRNDSSFLVYISLPSLVILLNTFVLVAIVRKAKESKVQNVSIFRHVSSTLVANTTFCVFAIVQVRYYLNICGYRLNVTLSTNWHYLHIIAILLWNEEI